MYREEFLGDNLIGVFLNMNYYKSYSCLKNVKKKVFFPIIRSYIFKIIQNPDEVVSEILFSINLIIGIFALKSLFNAVLFVFRKHV